LTYTRKNTVTTYRVFIGGGKGAVGPGGRLVNCVARRVNRDGGV